MTAEDEKLKTKTRPVRLLKFGGLTCPPCIAMERAKTLERLTEDFAQVEVVKLDVHDAEHETPDGSLFAQNYALSDEYEVTVLPTLVFEDTETGDELGRHEGAISSKDLRNLTRDVLDLWEEKADRRALSRKVKS